MSKELQPYQDGIAKAKERWQQIATSGFKYDVESIFAMQMLTKSDFAISVANSNPGSVRLAMINVASTGLTLNPANGYAYLVPRDGSIVLDISYKGLIKIATDTGSVQWARADLVYAQDQFIYHGPATIPDHVADPFKADRGDIIGAYCIAKTSGGDILTEVMPRAELEKIRDKSQAWIKKKAGPWAEWFEQMCKKAVIKRASKTWPYTEKADRLAQAIEIANNSEGGYDLEDEEAKAFRKKQEHLAAVGKNFKAVAYIKAELEKEDPDLHGVAEVWRELAQEDQIAIYSLAPTKGGTLTTKERDILHNHLPSFGAAA